MNKRGILILFILLIGMSSTVTIAQKVATTSMQFLKVMPGSRGAALGDAYTSLASGAEAYFWNPAGMVKSQNTEVALSYTSWILDTKLGALSASMPIGNIGTVGVGVQYVDYGTMDEAIWAAPYIDYNNNPGLTGRTFRPYALAAGVSYAKQLTDKFSTGITVKYVYESLYDGAVANAMTSQNVYESVNTWGKGILFDFGMLYNTGFKSLQLAIAAQNFGADIVYAKDKNPVPLQFRMGITGDLVGSNALLFESSQNRVLFAFDLFQPNDYAQQEHLGMEYSFKEVLFLRAGYKFNYDSEGLTLGIGVKSILSGHMVSFDYGYGSLMNDLGTVHRISIGASL